MSVFSVYHHVSRRHDATNYARLDLRLDFVSVGVSSKGLCKVSFELSAMPHIALNG
jgi:hypothetical protein